MKIVYGNIFEQDVDALVNPVNCEGVMGAGLAKQFKEKYPNMYKEYRKICKNGRPFFPGDRMSFFIEKDNLWVINLATKYLWKDNSQLEYIDLGVKNIAGLLRSQQNAKHPINSIAIPALGCGLGGLRWKDVKKIMEENLYPLNVDNKEVVVVVNNKEYL